MPLKSSKKTTGKKMAFKLQINVPAPFRPLPTLKPEIIGWFGWSILLKLKTPARPMLSHPVLIFKMMDDY
jgi:hypothetical protein